MIKIEHVAIWCKDLEKMKSFYCQVFQASANQKYTNQVTGFTSYFLSFPDGGPRLELMHRANIINNLNGLNPQHHGIVHFAIEVMDRFTVDKYRDILVSHGATIIRGPRVTGDGYYEIEALDIENNRLEVMSR